MDYRNSLTKRFHHVTAVDGLTLSVSEGQVFGLLGPTYEVDAMRAKMLVEGVSEFGLAVDFLVMVGTTGILTLIGAWLYPRLAQ